MPVTIQLYDHTRRKFAAGEFPPTHTFRLMLCTAATFDATHTALTDIVYTEHAAGTGYTAGGQALANVAVTSVDDDSDGSPDEARFDADDVQWDASGGQVSAQFAILYDDDDPSDAPVAFIDYGEVKTADDGTPFINRWNADGIVKFT